MYWLNESKFVGRGVADAELKYSGQGTPIASFSLAVPKSKEETQFPDFVAYGEVAERAAKQILKGVEVFITASRLSIDKYTDKQGQPRKSYVFVVNAFQTGYSAAHSSSTSNGYVAGGGPGGGPGEGVGSERPRPRSPQSQVQAVNEMGEFEVDF